MDDSFDQPDLVTDPAERSLVDDVRQLASDARTAASAEVAFQQSRAKVAAGSIGGIAARGAVALALVFFALVALVVGLLLALTPILTAWGATALVVVVLLAAALVFALWARSKWQRLSTVLAGEESAR